MRTAWDIETCPAPDDELQAVMPKFEAAANLRDPEKIAADIERKKADWIEKAALSAITGRVLAIGIMMDDEPKIAHGRDEALNIRWFWDVLPECGGLVGWNTHQFDLQFLVRRSWALGIPVPPVRDGRYWVSQFSDLREVWALGEYQAAGTMDQLARFFGIPPKLGDGKDFSKLYDTNQEDALEYLKRDLLIIRELERRMKV